MTKKRKSGRVIGYSTEMVAFNRLKKLGYFPIRSAGSHGQGDVYGIRQVDIDFDQMGATEVLAVQCKHFDQEKCPGLKMYDEDIAKLRELIPYGMITMLWIRIKGGKWYDFLVTDEAIYTISWSDNNWEIGEQTKFQLEVQQ